MDGWLAPMAGLARQRAFWEGFGRTPLPVSPLAYPTTRRAVRARSGRRHAGGREREGDAPEPIAARARGRRPGDDWRRHRTVVAWWVFGWVSYRLLVYWSPYFVRALDLPRTLTSWLPIMILAAVGCAALYGVRPGRSAPPSSGHDALPA
ncbi:MAG TPA: hypothetical protein VMO26_04585 [Vicinamibacterales bacterium]|nr:hypothetical protein [Vicinamibacterales bacterium]